MGLAVLTTNGPELVNDGRGLLGVSYQANEVAVARGLGQGSPTIYQEMVTQGIIDRSAYSLYLNDEEAFTGSILFGGVDSTKYTGDLVALPLQPVNDTVSTFYVALTDIFINDNTRTSSLTGQTLLVYPLCSTVEQRPSNYQQR